MNTEDNKSTKHVVNADILIISETPVKVCSYDDGSLSLEATIKGKDEFFQVIHFTSNLMVVAMKGITITITYSN